MEQRSVNSRTELKIIKLHYPLAKGEHCGNFSVIQFNDSESLKSLLTQGEKTYHRPEDSQQRRQEARSASSWCSRTPVGRVWMPTLEGSDPGETLAVNMSMITFKIKQPLAAQYICLFPYHIVAH